jgi:hypothetical protein
MNIVLEETNLNKMYNYLMAKPMVETEVFVNMLRDAVNESKNVKPELVNDNEEK